MRPLSSHLGPLAVGLLLAAASGPARADDIGDMLDSIPEIEDEEPEEESQEAEEQSDADDPLTEESFDDYSARVAAHLRAALKVPKSVRKKAPDSSAKILLRLHGDGSYMAVKGVKMSGNKKFDKAVLKAITNAEPVPGPPITLRGEAARGVVVEFTAD